MSAEPVGRVVDRERLGSLVTHATRGTARLLLLGDAGIGKSHLLEVAADLARGRGFRVVAGSAAAGPDASGDVLRRLVGPALAVPDLLPEELRERVAAAVTVPADPRTDAVALLAVVRRMVRDRPLAILVDDVHAATSAMIDTLSVLSRALSGERVMLLFAARGPLAPARLDPDVPAWHVGPLRPTEAAIVLDRQPGAPTGWRRIEVLRHTSGNPARIIELCAAVRAGTFPGRPVTLPRLNPVDERRMAALPAATRRVMLCAVAAQDTADLATVLSAARAVLADCAPAELAGLLVVVGDTAAFPDPLVRAHAYLGASPAERRAAHQALGEALPAGSDRAAFQLALAAGDTGDEVARSLEAMGTAAAARGDRVAAASAFDRGARAGAMQADGTGFDLTAGSAQDTARRYLLALREAVLAGDYVWCRQMAAEVRRLTADPDLLGAALVAEAQYRPLDGSGRDLPGEIRAVLAARPTDPAVLAGLAVAARVEGLVSGAGQYPGLAALLDPDAVPAAGADAPVDGGQLVAGIREWMRDRPAAATSRLRRARRHLRSNNAGAAQPFLYVVLLDALVECGLWNEAADLAAEAETVAAAGELPALALAVRALAVSMAVRRGEEESAAAELPALVAGLRDCGSDRRMVSCLVHQACARVHAAVGDHARACDHFEATFEPGGEPAHFAWSYRALTEFARSAAAANRHEVIFRVVAALRREPGPSQRRAALAEQALTLVADPADPAVEAVLRRAAGDRQGRERPYEHATAMVDYADWLHTRRRFRDARPLLSEARDAFVRLGAARDARYARDRLRAAGVSQEGPDRSAFDLLTAQQQFIARLASDGLSNRAIGDRLALSPRTVGSHLYRIYPKLGISSRRQLHIVIPVAS